MLTVGYSDRRPLSLVAGDSWGLQLELDIASRLAGHERSIASIEATQRIVKVAVRISRIGVCRNLLIDDVLVIVLGFPVVVATICGVVDIYSERIRVGPFQRTAIGLVAKISGSRRIQHGAAVAKVGAEDLACLRHVHDYGFDLVRGARKPAGAGGAGLSGGGIRALI